VPERRGDGGNRGLGPKGSGADRAVVGVRRQGSASSRQAQGHGRGTPQGGQAQESQGAAESEKSESGNPNRQRDEAPEAKPLSAAMPHAPKARQTPLIREGPALSGRADESIPADDQSRGGVNSRLKCLTERG